MSLSHRIWMDPFFGRGLRERKAEPVGPSKEQVEAHNVRILKRLSGCSYEYGPVCRIYDEDLADPLPHKDDARWRAVDAMLRRPETGYASRRWEPPFETSGPDPDPYDLPECHAFLVHPPPPAPEAPMWKRAHWRATVWIRDVAWRWAGVTWPYPRSFSSSKDRPAESQSN
jgi:hypothetical protein